MNKDIYEKVRKNPKFSELIKKRNKFAWKLSFSILVIYYSFILVIAFTPETLAIPLGEGVTTIGIPIGIFIILISFILTGIYTKKANTEFDKLTNDIKDDIRFDI